MGADIEYHAPAATNQMSKREFSIYCVFMICFSLATYLDRGDEKRFFLRKLLVDDLLTTTWHLAPGQSNVSKTFRDIANVPEFYGFTGKVLLPFLLQETGDNGEPLPLENLYYPHNNKLLGIRLRVLRVKPESCDKTGLTTGTERTCYARYSSSVETREPYGPGGKYQWSPAADQIENSFWGKLTWYDGGGYFQDMPMNQTLAQARLAELRADNWLDDAVRIVFIDFQMYNEVHNLHTVARLAIEYPHSGGALPSTSIVVIKLNRYFSWRGKLQLFCEFAVMFFTLFFFTMEIMEMRELGLRKYIRQGWNVLDIINILIFIVVGISRFYYFFTLQDLDPVLSPERYQSLQQVVNAHFIESVLVSFNAFLLWVKLLKFMQANKKIDFLFRTFVKAASELAFFGIMFLALLCGFAHAGFIMFSDTSKQFRDVQISIISVIASMNSGMDNDEILEDNIITGWIFTFGFELTITMILINMFLAIINTAYDQVASEDLAAESDELIPINLPDSGIFAYFRRCFKKQNKVEPNDAAPPVLEKQKNIVPQLKNENVVASTMTMLERMQTDLDHLLAKCNESKAILGR